MIGARRCQASDLLPSEEVFHKCMILLFNLSPFHWKISSEIFLTNWGDISTNNIFLYLNAHLSLSVIFEGVFAAPLQNLRVNDQCDSNTNKNH